MYKAVIFDLNGVFIKAPLLSERFRDDFGVPLEEFLPALKEVMSKVRLPDAESLYSYWKPYFEKWGVDMSENQLHEYWFGAEKEVPEMTALARQLKGNGIRVLIVSNNFRERAGHYERTFGFLREISDGLYYSWRTGFVKPDERVYKSIMEEHGLRPAECIYFDDSDKNVKVASGLGIKSFLFRDFKETERQLSKLGLPIA